jgi:hypothetical protein
VGDWNHQKCQGWRFHLEGGIADNHLNFLLIIINETFEFSLLATLRDHPQRQRLHCPESIQIQ